MPWSITSSSSDALDGGQAAVQLRSPQRDEALGAQVQRCRLEGRPKYLCHIHARGQCFQLRLTIGLALPDKTKGVDQVMSRTLFNTPMRLMAGC